LLSLLPVVVRPQSGDSTSAERRLVRSVCSKEIVVLGELPSHGEARTFQAKARIVQRLVDECGFGALLFESPVYDFLDFQRAAAAKQATAAQLDLAIGRFWVTRELADWRRWLLQRATAGTLVLGGLDDQVSVTSDYARATLPRLIASSLPPERATECEAAVKQNLFWLYDAQRQFDEPERILLQSCARAASADGATGGSGA
jgi:erythromycin esterase-like protein